MPSCSVKWCLNHTSTCSLKSKNGVSFHKFPRDKDLCQKWVEAVRLERHDPWWTSTKASRICSIHFKQSDMMVTPCKVNVLTKNAVPICTMVWYDSENRGPSNYPNNKKMTINNNNITMVYETEQSLSEVHEESKTNVSNDNKRTSQETDRDFEMLKEAENKSLNGCQDIETKSIKKDNKDQVNSFDMSEFIKFNKKDTCVKLNENTSVILKEDPNEVVFSLIDSKESNIPGVVPNSNTCESNNVINENFNFENKKQKDNISDKSIIDLCSADIQEIDLKSTFVGKILKTYLPKRKIKNTREKKFSEVLKENNEKEKINIENDNNEILDNMLNETSIKIHDNSIYGAESHTESIQDCNTVLCEEFLVNECNLIDHKEPENTDFNEINLDMVDKLNITINKDLTDEIYTESNENIYVPSGRELCVESSLGFSNKTNDSNTRLILDLDTNLYTEINMDSNIIDKSQEYCELTNEPNNQLNDITGTSLITDLMGANERTPLNNNSNTLSHINELLLIDMSHSVQLKDNLIPESEYDILNGFDNEVTECQQNSAILNNNEFSIGNKIVNTETSDNIEIGLQNLQFEEEPTLSSNPFQPKNLEENVKLVNIESSVDKSNLEDASLLNVAIIPLSENNEKGFPFSSIGDETQVINYENTLEPLITVERNVLTDREIEETNVNLNNLLWVENQNEDINQSNQNLSASLNANNEAHCENNYEIQCNDGDTRVSELCNGGKSFKTRNETCFPELLKHLSAKPKMDSLAELCTNSLTKIDKKIYYKYGNTAILNKKRLQDTYRISYDGEELNKKVDVGNNMVTILNNNIEVSEEEQFNPGVDHLESSLVDNMDLINGLESSIAEQILSEEIITNNNNLFKPVENKLRDNNTEITPSELDKIIQNESLAIPKDTISRIDENINDGLPNKDLGKLCGKFCLHLENVSPISEVIENNVAEEDIQVIESNLDIDKENSSEFDISLLLGDSIPDPDVENLVNNSDNNSDCNEKGSPGDQMDLRSVDIPESIDGILDEEGSLFENLDLLENDSLDSNGEIRKESNESNLNETKSIEEPMSVPNFDQLLDYFPNETFCGTDKEHPRNCASEFESKAEQLVESLIESSTNMNLNSLEQSKEQFTKNCCISIRKLYNETLEQYRLNLEDIKKQISEDHKIKGIVSELKDEELKSFQLNKNGCCDITSNLQSVEFRNDINLNHTINSSGLQESKQFQDEKSEEIIDELVSLGDVGFENNETPFIREFENSDSGSGKTYIETNKNCPIELNVIVEQKNLHLRQELEQEEELIKNQDIDMSNIDEIFDEICNHQTVEIENELSDQTKEEKNNNKKLSNIKSSFSVNNNRILKDLHNKSVELSGSVKQDIHNVPTEYRSDKLTTVPEIQHNVKLLKRELFGQCFSAECGNICKKGHRNIPKNNMSLFKKRNIEISHNLDIKQQRKKKQNHVSSLYKKQPNLRKQKNKHLCESHSKEKVKLKYKEFSIDLLKGQCFEFSQKGDEDESNLRDKKIKRKYNEPTVESRKMQCTESIIEENKCDKSIELSFKNCDTNDNKNQDNDCNALKEIEEECPNCGYVTSDDDVDLNIKEPLSVINEELLLSNTGKKNNKSNENKKVPLRSVYAMELAYVTAIQALQKKLKKKMAVCDYRLRKMKNLAQINNRLIKHNISLKCKKNVI